MWPFVTAQGESESSPNDLHSHVEEGKNKKIIAIGKFQNIFFTEKSSKGFSDQSELCRGFWEVFVGKRAGRQDPLKESSFLEISKWQGQKTKYMSLQMPGYIVWISFLGYIEIWGIGACSKEFRVKGSS